MIKGRLLSWWPGSHGPPPTGGGQGPGSPAPPCVCCSARAALALTPLPFSPPGHREHLPGRRQLRHVRLLHARPSGPGSSPSAVAAPFSLPRPVSPSASQGPRALQDGRSLRGPGGPQTNFPAAELLPPAPGRGALTWRGGGSESPAGTPGALSASCLCSS